MRISDWSSDVCSSDLSLLVYHADVAGVEPIIGQYAIGFPLIAPIAFHHQFTADRYLAIIGDAHLCVLERRADRVHFQPRPWPVATYDWPSLGLAIALEQVKTVEEQSEPPVPNPHTLCL